MGILGSLFVNLKASTANFDKSMKKSGKRVGGLQKQLKGLGRTLAVTFGGYAALRFLQSSQEAYTRQADAVAKLGATLQATGHAAGFAQAELVKMAGALQQLTAVGDEEIINAQAMLATFRNISGFVFTETIKSVLDLSAAMDQDLRSSVVMLGKALNDPVLGLTALQRTGITFSQTQKDHIKSLMEQNRLFEAQAEILDELKKQFGGTAEAMRQTTAGELRALKAEWGDFQEQVGGAWLEFKMGILETAKALAGSRIVEQIREVRKESQILAEINKASFRAQQPMDVSGLLPEEQVKKLSERMATLHKLRALAEDLQKASGRVLKTREGPGGAFVDLTPELMNKRIAALRKQLDIAGKAVAVRKREATATESAAKAVEKLLEKYRGLRAKMEGVSEAELALRKLRAMPGVTPDQIAEVTVLSGIIAAMEKVKARKAAAAAAAEDRRDLLRRAAEDRAARADAFREQVKGPVERLGDLGKTLKELRTAGLLSAGVAQKVLAARFAGLMPQDIARARGGFREVGGTLDIGGLGGAQRDPVLQKQDEQTALLKEQLRVLKERLDLSLASS